MAFLPRPPSGQWFDPKTGQIKRHALNWLNALRDKIGGDSELISQGVGGTGAASLAELAAALGGATSTGSGTELTQSEMGVTLNRPATGDDGEVADTTVTWDAAFADTTYNVTLSFHGLHGAVSEVTASRTTTSIVVRLTNTLDGYRTRGTVDATGVHA